MTFWERYCNYFSFGLEHILICNARMQFIRAFFYINVMKYINGMNWLLCIILSYCTSLLTLLSIERRPWAKVWWLSVNSLRLSSKNNCCWQTFKYSEYKTCFYTKTLIILTFKILIKWSEILRKYNVLFFEVILIQSSEPYDIILKLN